MSVDLLGFVIKYLYINVVEDMLIVLLKMLVGGMLLCYCYDGEVFVYMLQGVWCYCEYDWVVYVGLMVFELVGLVYMLEIFGVLGEDVIMLNVMCGDFVLFDDEGCEMVCENCCVVLLCQCKYVCMVLDVVMVFVM